MNHSLQIAKLFGIPVKLHWTFLLLVGWIVYVALAQWGRLSLESIGWLSLSVFVLFACVVLHELGHALTARRYGVQTRNILLLPIGGLAVLDRLPDQPLQEFKVALAGPMVNMGLAVFFAPFLLAVPPDNLKQITAFIINPAGNVFVHEIPTLDWFLVALVALNILVGLFNLLPAFPMDGGRILRALLSTRLPRLKATRIATYLGQFFALLLLVYSGLTYNWPMGLIALFVFFTATNEYRSVRQESMLDGFKVSDIYRTEFTKLYQQETIARAQTILQRGLEKYFLVFDEWQTLRGVLLESDILKSIKNSSPDGRVINYERKSFEYLTLPDTLPAALQRMQNGDYEIMPVCDKYGKLVGVLDVNMLENFIRIQQKIGAKNKG